MNRAVQLFKDWMLPLAIATGISLYLFYHFTPFLKPYGSVLHQVASEGQRFIIALLLFFQFVQISPHDVRLRRWHLWALLVQVGGFLLFAGLSALVPGGAGRILLECAMICLICPCAAAAGVITRKLDGDLAATVSYLCLTNLAATFLIPMVIPMVRPASDLGFWTYVLRITLKVFPVLVLPGLLAWTIRYTTHKLQRRLMRFAPNSFYVWFFGLTLAMVLASHALFVNYPGGWTLAGIVAISMATCAFQFFVGRRIGYFLGLDFHGSRVDSITAGQGLGQKNTGFLIWLGYNYLTPVTSVAGGLYAIWQNLFNSWELYEHEHSKK